MKKAIALTAILLLALLSANSYAKRTQEDVVIDQSSAALNAIGAYEQGGMAAVKKSSIACYDSYKIAKSSPWECVYLDLAALHIQELVEESIDYFSLSNMEKRFAFFIKTMPVSETEEYLSVQREVIDDLVDNLGVTHMTVEIHDF